MVETFKSTFILYSSIGLFVIAAISFTSLLVTENNVDNDILTNDQLNSTFGDLLAEFNSSQSDLQVQKNSFDSEIPERGFGSLIIFSIVGVTQQFGNVVTGIYNVVVVLPASFLGIPKVILDVLGSILIVTIVLLAWRVYRVGA